MIIIIDYGLGNLGSVKNTLDRLEINSVISGDPSVLEKAKALILPGVGAAGAGMNNLKRRKLIEVITDKIQKGTMFIGICLGMQLLFEQSEEGNVKCLGLIKGTVKKFTGKLKIPQIGWNQVKIQKSKYKNILIGIPDKSYFYFVNSYYCVPTDKSIIAGESYYGERFASILVKNNIVATQFHPEKSADNGSILLKNIIRNYVS